ncbi:hypothetical protein [Actinophytocola glycyrrhizae]|uniref:Uncharacterized protein n=1 Tax=Actinophytocola glycyrrhizae TaxID=2044873 RepID=A0ABV9SG70_9PSEU
MPGQLPWTPYPGQQPGPGMPMAPPPRRRGLVWTVVGLVVVLAAAGVAYLLVRESTGDGPGEGSARDGGGCTGDYCVGGHPYVNACGVFDPSGVVSLIGSAGSGRLHVQETYADPLPRVEDPARAAWTYGLTSSCHVSPEDRDGAVFHSVTLELKQTANEAPVPRAAGRPLPGVDGAVVEDLDGGARVHWRHRNISATLSVVWTNRKAAVPDTTMAGVVDTITRGFVNPPSEPRGLGDLSEGGEQVVIDACTVYTGADFQSATKYVVNPTNVRRTYSTTATSPLRTTCSRFTAPPNAGLPAPEGTTFLDGSMSPKVTVTKHPDPAAAKAELDRNRERIDGAVEIPGIGDGAVFGVGSASHFTLRFTAGFHLVTVDCGLSNGNADWTAEDMRGRLEPLATSIAERMS